MKDILVTYFYMFYMYGPLSLSLFVSLSLSLSCTISYTCIILRWEKGQVSIWCYFVSKSCLCLFKPSPYSSKKTLNLLRLRSGPFSSVWHIVSEIYFPTYNGSEFASPEECNCLIPLSSKSGSKRYSLSSAGSAGEWNGLHPAHGPCVLQKLPDS